MSEISVLACMCQECRFEFPLLKSMTNIVDLDTDIESTKCFMDLSLNTIHCPQCDNTYTYEIPMLIISSKQKYAIKVNPSSFGIDSPKYSYPRHLIPNDFKLREVNFLIEALEKHLIFSSGNDDYEIELIKRIYFSDTDTLPFDETNMVFQKRENNKYYFTKYNSTNNILGVYKKVVNNTKIPRLIKQENPTSWQVINRLTINNYIDKENGYE